MVRTRNKLQLRVDRDRRKPQYVFSLPTRCRGFDESCCLTPQGSSNGGGEQCAGSWGGTYARAPKVLRCLLLQQSFRLGCACLGDSPKRYDCGFQGERTQVSAQRTSHLIEIPGASNPRRIFFSLPALELVRAPLCRFFRQLLQPSHTALGRACCTHAQESDAAQVSNWLGL